MNIALALAAEGARVSLLDARHLRPVRADAAGRGWQARIERAGTDDSARALRHSGQLHRLLIDNDAPMAWRGPMVSQALQQLFSQTAWNDLDYLIVDMPPGTGDIQLCMFAENFRSAVWSSSLRQDLALMDARTGLSHL